MNTDFILLGLFVTAWIAAFQSFRAYQFKKESQSKDYLMNAVEAENRELMIIIRNLHTKLDKHKTGCAAR